MKKNQKGFSLVEFMIIVVVLAVVGFAGWYVWDSKKTPAATNQTSSSETHSADSKALNITEWGVGFTLNEDATGSYYKLRQEGEYAYVDVYNSNLDQLKNRNGEPCKEELLLVIARYTANDERLDDPTNQKPTVTIADYGYTGVGQHQAPPDCAPFSEGENTEEFEENNKDILSSFAKYRNALEESFENLKAL